MVMERTGRFVLHRHTRGSGKAHWDLMFEKGQMLETYRLEAWPGSKDAAIEGEKIFEHPLKFLSYQGSVNKGAGCVIMEDCGSYSVVSETAGEVIIKLSGNLLNCKAIGAAGGRGNVHFEFRPCQD
jgi:hypothetical protein